jgi:hypothetical protein
MLVSSVKDKLKGIEAELEAQTDRGAAIIGAAIDKQIVHRERYIRSCSGAAAYFAAITQANIRLTDIRDDARITSEVDAIFEQMMNKATKALEPYLKQEPLPEI